MTPFVGRERELDIARSAVDDALDGRASVLLIGGGPGMGKTRLADELEATARARGAEVVWGRAWEAGGAPAYWPWVQSLRSLQRAPEWSDVSTGATERRVDLLRSPLGDGEDEMEPTSPDADAARFRFFDDVASFLAAFAARRPLVLVLDDLHAADASSLLLLRFVASALDHDRVLVVGTYREPMLQDSPLTRTLFEIERERRVRRIALHGLSEADVERYVESAFDRRAVPTIATALHARSEGNPLFMREFVRLLLDEGSAAEGRLGDSAVRTPAVPVPSTIRDVILRRLEPLPEVTRDVLRLAAILGREFDLEALSRLSGLRRADLEEVLRSGLQAAVLSVVPGTTDRLRFSHILIRESIHDDVARADRIRLHAMAGATIEDLYRHELEPHLAEIALHYLEAAADGDEARAIAYAREAGDRALRLLAYEEAVRLYSSALELMRHSPAPDLALRADLLISLGDAHSRAGDEVLAEETFLQAAETAEQAGLRRHLARAALGYGGPQPWKRAGGDERIVPLLRHALDAVGDDDPELRARLLARLAGALRDDPSVEPRESLAQESVAIARRIGDPATLAWCLEAMFGAIWRPDDLDRQLQVADELIELGQRFGDGLGQLSGQHYRMILRFEAGDRPGMARAFAEQERLVLALRLPTQTWFAGVLRSLFALFEGRFDEVDALTDAAYELGSRAYTRDARVHRAMHLFQLRREQGRVAEIEAELRRVADAFPVYPMCRAALALTCLDLGRADEARMVFATLTGGDFAAIPWDNEWIFTMSLLAEVAHLLGDRARAAAILERMVPFADRVAVGPAEGCTGSVHRAIALLEATIGRTEDAATSFERALETNAAMEARPWVAHTEHAYARLLIERGLSGDLARARVLLEDARATAEGIGMVALRQQVDEAFDRLNALEGPVAARPMLPATGRRRLTFAREGDVWAIGPEGAVRIRDSKGLRYLALLIASPGRELHVLDLVGLISGSRVGRSDGSGETGLAIDGAGGIDTGIDDEAREAYRARLRELRAELDAAEAAADVDGAERARLEMDALTEELSRAYGLHGPRRSASPAERARQSVTKAIHDALARIEDAEPAVGEHLRRSVRTGTYCAYDPDPEALPEWHLRDAPRAERAKDPLRPRMRSQGA